jgi:outer membrane protein TolC
MKSSVKKQVGVLIRPCMLMVFVVQVGCAALSPGEPARHVPPASQTAQPARASAEIQTVSYQEVGPSLPEPRKSPAAAIPEAHAAPFVGISELSLEALVQEVLGRNPSLAQMVAAWQAASARYPQVTSLEDPMFAGTIGPGTFAPDDKGVNFAYRLEISQKLPFPRKLKLRGENALAEASAAGHDVEDVRLQLIESVQDAFYEYYLVERALEVNMESLKLWQQAKKDAESRYETGKVDQQDVLQADVEIGRERERRLTLEEMRQIAVARINTLMHLPPDSALPPPPKEVQLAEGLPEVQALRTNALARRPDLQALADRIAAEQAALDLAHKEFYPDFEPFFMYDRFMGNMPENRDLAPMLGVRLNVPLYKARRYGAVSEAQAKIAQRQAELARQVDQVNFQVQQAYEKVRKSEKAVKLYKDTILPAAELNAKAARTAYVAGKITALSRIEAERNLVSLRDRYFEAIADYFRRRATLERVIGTPLTPWPPPGDLGHPDPVPVTPCARLGSPK